LSGGIDSTACVGYYISQECNVSALFVDYGQASVKHERKAASAVADYFGIPLKQLNVSGCNINDGYIKARNAMLLSTALMSFEHRSGIVALGIHSGTPYVDCSPDFKHLMQQIYDLYEDGRVRIDAPFLNWTKSEIWDYALTLNVPLELTYSNNLGSLSPIADHLRVRQ
jgi:7-cyano-7-deazaguanine synthase